LSFVFQKIQPNPDINFSAIQLDSILSKTFNNPYWKRSEYTLRNLESSGKLSTITNDDLKNKLYDWSLVATEIKDKDSDASNGFNNLLNYYKENGSLRNLDAFGTLITEARSSLEYDHVKFFSDIIFENIIDDYLVFTRSRISKYEKAKIIIDQIIEITLTEE
jgi:hypothetical protein